MSERQKYPELVQQAQIREMLGVSRQRVEQRTREADFPAPAYRFATGLVWYTEDVIRWALEKGLTAKAPASVTLEAPATGQGDGRPSLPVDGVRHGPKIGPRSMEIC